MYCIVSFVIVRLSASMRHFFRPASMFCILVPSVIYVQSVQPLVEGAVNSLLYSLTALEQQVTISSNR